MQKSRVISLSLLFSFLAFAALSWWLLFRDERALAGIEFFLPSLDGQLFRARSWLLTRGLNTLPTLAFGAVAVVASSSYLLSLFQNISKRTSVQFAIFFQIIAFLAYPVLSTDIFSYMFSDRVFTEYGQNIWKVTPDTFSEDPYEQLADWKDQTKVYGAINQIIYLPASYLGGENLILTLLLYKLVSLIFALAALGLVAKMTDSLGEQKQAQAIRLLFWNPLFVLEIAGTGHNDIAMIFFFLLSLFMYWNKRWLWAGVVLALSVQVKMITGVFLIFAAIDLLKNHRIKELLQFGGAFVFINLLAFSYMQVSPLDFLARVFANTSVYWQSLPAVVHRFWEHQKTLFTPLLLISFVGMIWYQWQRNIKPLFATTVFLLIYLLFFSEAYWNWYVLWILPSVIFIKERWLRVMIIAFSLTSLFAYPLLWVSQRFGYNHIGWSFLYYLWIFVVPILIGLMIFLNKDTRFVKMLK